MAENSDKKNTGLIALFFIAVASLVYSILKAVRHLYVQNREGRKVAELVRSGLAEGLTEDQIVQAFCADAEKHLGRALKASEIDRIENLVIRENDKQK